MSFFKVDKKTTVNLFFFLRGVNFLDFASNAKISMQKNKLGKDKREKNDNRENNIPRMLEKTKSGMLTPRKNVY